MTLRRLPRPQVVKGTPSRIGVHEIMPVLLDLQRDIKMISEAQCLNGATNLAQRWGKGHRAEEGDINNDGIPDVVIYDENDNPVVVNGYTTTQSNHPVRYQYFTENPTKDSRKANPMSKWKRNIYGAAYDDDENPFKRTSIKAKPEWLSKAESAHYRTIKEPKETRSPYQAFQEVASAMALDIMEHVYGPADEKGIFRDAQGKTVPDKRGIIMATAFAYNTGIVGPAISNTTDEEWPLQLFAKVLDSTATDAERKQVNKIKNSKAVKKAIKEHVTYVWNNSDEAFQYIAPLIGYGLNVWRTDHGLSPNYKSSEPIVNMEEFVFATIDFVVNTQAGVPVQADGE